ncbi:nuclear transport factor 2 family protein [Phenylobacterium sp. LjRoot225]|uniref:nuclear transport factor 2 family protein n=1 Tax=Phenylobacterium sp. LjRoot225 TaxID=3342285 RepID=UPI003ECE6C66
MATDLLGRLAALEAESAIRRLMAEYMRLCDQLDAATPMEELGELFTEDAVWAGGGGRYAATFGAHEGRDAIVAMLGRYRGPPPHFAMNAHFLCSEAIAVHGPRGEGAWTMLQTSTFADGSSQLSAARLDVAFARKAGSWRIARFTTTNLFSRPVRAWDDPAPLPVPAT